MYGWLRKTFGRKATKTAGKEVSQEVAGEVGEATTKSTTRRVGEVAVVGGVLLYPEEIVAKAGSILGAGLGGLGKGATQTLFDSPVMVGVGLLMVGGIFYVVFK
jgi:hypothetical protein